MRRILFFCFFSMTVPVHSGYFSFMRPSMTPLEQCLELREKLLKFVGPLTSQESRKQKTTIACATKCHEELAVMLGDRLTEVLKLMNLPTLHISFVGPALSRAYGCLSTQLHDVLFTNVAVGTVAQVFAVDPQAPDELVVEHVQQLCMDLAQVLQSQRSGFVPAFQSNIQPPPPPEYYDSRSPQSSSSSNFKSVLILTLLSGGAAGVWKAMTAVSGFADFVKSCVSDLSGAVKGMKEALPSELLKQVFEGLKNMGGSSGSGGEGGDDNDGLSQPPRSGDSSRRPANQDNTRSKPDPLREFDRRYRQPHFEPPVRRQRSRLKCAQFIEERGDGSGVNVPPTVPASIPDVCANDPVHQLLMASSLAASRVKASSTRFAQSIDPSISLPPKDVLGIKASGNSSPAFEKFIEEHRVKFKVASPTPAPQKRVIQPPKRSTSQFIGVSKASPELMSLGEEEDEEYERSWWSRWFGTQPEQTKSQEQITSPKAKPPTIQPAKRPTPQCQKGSLEMLLNQGASRDYDTVDILLGKKSLPASMKRRPTTTNPPEESTAQFKQQQQLKAAQEFFRKDPVRARKVLDQLKSKKGGTGQFAFSSSNQSREFLQQYLKSSQLNHRPQFQPKIHLPSSNTGSTSSGGRLKN